MRRVGIPILLSGLIGSGKSTLAQALAKKYGLNYISGSHVHREILAEKLGVSVRTMNTPGFWESETGKKGTALREKHLSMDKAVDQRLLKKLRVQKSVISDARLMPWLYKGNAIRIWLTAPENERVKRVRERDGRTLAHAKAAIRKRGHADQVIYKKLYRIAFGEDLSPFDLVLNNAGFEAKETFRVVDAFIQSKLAKNSG